MTSVNMMSEAPIITAVSAAVITVSEPAADDTALFPCVTASTIAVPETTKIDVTATARIGDTEPGGDTAIVSAVGAATMDDDAALKEDGETESHGTGVDGVASAPRSRRGGARRRQRKETEDAANERGPWLNADQAAEYMALSSRKALYELVRAGRLPYYRFGHSLRFRREELDEVIAAGRMRPAVYERRKKEIAVDSPSCADPDEDYDRVDARLQQEGGK